MLLQGIFLPVLTPFYPDGRVYFRKLEHNVERYSRTPAAGMLLLGPDSESEGLRDADAREALKVAVEASAAEKVMLAGVVCESVFESLLQVEFAAGLNYDGIVLAAPRFASDPAMHRETLLYFQSIADRSPLPIILAGNPSVETIAELAQHPSIVAAIVPDAAVHLDAIAKATVNVQRQVTVTSVFAAATRRMLLPQAAHGSAQSFVSAETLGQGGTALAIAPPVAAIRTRTKTVGFQVLEERTEAMHASLNAGATGAVPRLAVCAPQACCEVFQAWKDEDAPLAREKQERLAAAARLTEGPGGASWAKHGCDLNGYFGGRPRLPLIALNGEQRAQMEQAMVTLLN